MANTYRALTRKYRPQSFEDVVSQQHVSSTLKNAIKQNRLSHAYMFCGPRGVGKTTMARVLARSINNIDDTVDGESLSQTLNVVEIDAASNNKVEDVHHLREIVRVPPQSGSYKVFIIDEVHMLSKQAFNALLKTLEEPPAHAIFIFATTEPHKVLPTILSRVQRFDFKRISVDEIVERLSFICKDEQITIDNESLHTIAKKADGALRDALGLMDQAIAFCGTNIQYNQLVKALNVVGNDDLFEFTDAVAEQSSQTSLLLIDRLLKDGADIQEFLVSLTSHIRNLYVAKQAGRMHLIEATGSTKERYLATAEHFTETDLLRMLHLVSEAQIKIRDVQQPRVHFEILMLKLVHMGRSEELQELLAVAKQLKKNGSSIVKNSATPTEAINSSSPIKNEDPVETFSPSSDESEKNEPTSLSNNVENRVKETESEHVEKDAPKTNVEEDELEFLMGRPSLGYIPGANSDTKGKKIKKEPAVSLPQPETATVQSLEGIENEWERVLEQLKKTASKMLYLQLRDVQLRDLKGTELIVSVNNQFAVNMVEENKQLLGNVFKQIIGVFIRMKCIVENSEKKSAETLSPFDRFMEVQKKDTHLKTIVDLFGAEIEYTN